MNTNTTIALLDREPDFHLLHLHAKAREDYYNLSQPYLRKIREVHALLGSHFMVVKNGVVVEVGTRLPEDAMKMVAQLREMIAYCYECAFREFNEYTARFGGPTIENKKP